MSRLAENLIDIFNVIGNDETLLRLLYYKDDPLNPSKTNVKDLDNFNAIRKERIIRSPKSDDLTENTICRICMYFGDGRNLGRNSSEKVTDQNIHFDVFAHIEDYDMNDARSLMICDRVNNLMYDKNITGVGKMRNSQRRIIANAPSGYIGYMNVFVFGSVK